MQFDPIPFNVTAAVLEWLKVVGIFFGGFFLLGLLIALLSGGKSGVSSFLSSIKSALLDFASMSPKRIWALSRLTFLEAIRNRVLLVFVIFVVLFMFAGWFLPETSARAEEAVERIVTIPLRVIAGLNLLMILILSCWSLPNDIKARSLHTVITKPARRNEVVIGRMLGLTGIATMLVGMMGLIGYVWVLRVTPERAQDELISRVPVYGNIGFTDRNGLPARSGVNVGDIWNYRSYIAGGTKASAIWAFPVPSPEAIEKPFSEVKEDIQQKAAVESVKEGQPPSLGDLGYTLAFDEERDEIGPETPVIELESSFEAFRTTKGNLEAGLFARVQLTNRYRRNFAQVLGFDRHLEDVEIALIDFGFKRAAEQLEIVAEGLEDNEWNNIVPRQSSTNQLLWEETDKPVSAFEYGLIENSMLGANGILESVEKRLTSLEQPTDWLGEIKAALKTVSEAAAAAKTVASDDPEKVTDTERQALASALRELASSFEANLEQLETRVIDLIAVLPPVEVREYRSNNIVFTPELHYADRDVTDAEKETLPLHEYDPDLYRDFVVDGQMTIEVFCEDVSQLLGMARRDLFIRTADRPFASGYAKAVFSLWLFMVMIIILGVTASTFVKGPVATLLVIAMVVLGTLARSFILELVSGELKGHGPLEAMVRLFQHKNPNVPLDPGPLTTFVTFVDERLLYLLDVVRALIPNFEYVDMTPYVAKGFDVPFNEALLPCIMITLGLLIPCILISHFSLKLREIEAK